MLGIGSRLELFVDDWLIERLEGLSLRLQSPTPREVVLKLDAPWEGPNSYDPIVFRDGDLYRLYYRGGGDELDRTCFAESRDGVHFTRVRVGAVEYAGSRENNIVIDGDYGGHAVCVFRDGNPLAPAGQRYKATGLATRVGNRDRILGLASEDGLHWRLMQEEPIIEGPPDQPYFDSHNIFFWDERLGQYAGYLRGRRDPFYRWIRRGTSPDFVHWSALEAIDTGDAPSEHLYKNACQPYFRAPQLYLMFPKRFVPHRQTVPSHPYPGVSDAVFMSSRDGLRFDRRFMEAFLRPGRDVRNWTDRNLYIGPNLVPTSPDEMSLYYIEHYHYDDCRIRRATLRTDGLVAVHAGYSGGELLTRPFTFAGAQLVINYATSAVGCVRVELQYADGRTVPGCSLDESSEIYGDEIERVVSWKSDSYLQAMAGVPVRLRIALRDADLYSLRFRPWA
ncbi:MAG: hypothetical protein GX557_02190 [Chloroflexi bacterium]|nr:hypothetical protein [Chloroflexota bacterium]